jgi:hypothetical protein
MHKGDHHFSSFPSITTVITSRRMRTRHVAWTKEIGTTYKILVGKSEGKTSLMRPGPT